MPTEPPLSPADPAPPPDPAADWRTATTGTIVAVVLAGALIAAIGVGVFNGIAPRSPRRPHFTCQQNLNQLGSLHAMLAFEGSSAATERSGSALFLAWRKAGKTIMRGKEEVMLCPDDPLAAQMTDATRARYDSVDPDDAPRELCSYAVRDFGRFPLPATPAADEILAACTGHANGANVVYSDGAIRYLTWAELGLTGPEEADVGPAAKSPLLRKVCRRPGETGK